MVFVTGQSAGAGGSDDYVTIGYDARTGNRQWVKRYNGPANGLDEAFAVSIRPDGQTAFITGFSEGTDGTYDYASIAYDTATGRDRWISRYSGPAGQDDYGWSILPNPGGSRVYVAGYGYASNGFPDYETIALDAASGSLLWEIQYDGPAHGSDLGHALAVAPDGSRVFVSGDSEGVGTGQDAATIAYTP